MLLPGAQDPLVGRAVGEFVLLERIGEGGWGTVYRAEQTALSREAVVKLLHPRLRRSANAVERFLREVKLAATLDHPYAAHVYAFGVEPDGRLWIAMELVRGTPLDQILKLQGPLSLERFSPLLDRICEVVHTAHEQGIVHRDLKPANIMVLARAGSLLPKLLDFGLAKRYAVDDAEEVDRNAPIESLDASGLEVVTGLTLHGAVIGSPHYMAPEQWADAGDVDSRADLYALGVLAYECLTGGCPFLGATIHELAVAHAEQPVPSLGNGFPEAIDRILAKALAKRPEERYPDALAFARAFREAAGMTVSSIALPAIDKTCRDAAVTGAPQPIAEAVAMLEAARNPHQARDALVQLARTITRYLALLALACRSRVTTGHEPSSVASALRTMYRRHLRDEEWLGLCVELTSPWLSRRDAYPIPELIDAFRDDTVLDGLRDLLSLHSREPTSDDLLVGVLETSVAQVSRLLEALAFISDYALVVTVGDDLAERWMGVRRVQRMTTHVHGKSLPVGVPALVDKQGTPVLSLAPLFAVASPTPGAPVDLFLFDGRDARGAKLVTLPAGFEYHDDAVWEWFRAQIASSFDDSEVAVGDAHSPYRGLQAFSTEDGASFFGRDKLVDTFVNRVKVQPVLAVVGRSGAGKSSFVHAGVIPALPEGWRAISLRPGAKPLGALTARLEYAGFAPIAPDAIAARPALLGEYLRQEAARGGPVVLVIDQLEELFTLCRDAAARAAFADAVAGAVRSADDPVRVIFTLRDDFLVRTEQLPALRGAIDHGLQLLTVPGTDDLRRILVEPARRAGYELEAGLADEMLKEVADHPGALALLSFTAAKLWELRDRQFRQLTRAAYTSLGGIGGALARHADDTLDAMPVEERALAREAFRQLVTSQHTRALLIRRDLLELLGASAHAERVIEKLVAARLLVASENEAGVETIELVHEALLVAWPRLVEWLREDAEGVRFHEQLRAAAEQWQERGRAKGLLWRGDALADFTRWRSRHQGRLTVVEAAFTDASLADAARGRRLFRLAVVSAFFALAVGTVVLAWLSAQNRSQANQLHDQLRDQYEDEGRRFVLAGDPLRALAYLDSAARLGARGKEHDFLVAQAVQASDGELLEVQHSDKVADARFSADGTRMITASGDRTAKIWDASTGALLVTLPHGDSVTAAAFAPDGQTALTTSSDGVSLWDTHTAQLVRHFAHRGDVWCAEYSPDGSKIVTAGTDDEVAVWDARDGTQLLHDHGSGAGASACAFSPDGTTVAVGDAAGVIRLWKIAGATDATVFHDHGEYVTSVAFSPDGRLLASASRGGRAIVHDLAARRTLPPLVHRGPVRALAFDHDGKRIVTGSSDRTATIWNASTGARLVDLIGHAGPVAQALFTPDGAHVVTASEDGSAWLWDAANGQPLARWRGHLGRLWGLAIDRAGARVLTAGDDGKAVMWATAARPHTIWLPGQTNAQFDARGERIVSIDAGGGLHVFAATTGAELRAMRDQEKAITVTFSPDGKQVASLGTQGTLTVWDLDGARRWSTNVAGAQTAIAWSRDGRAVAVGTFNGVVQVLDGATGARRFEIAGHGGKWVQSVAFDPSAQHIITTGADQTTRIWTATGQPVAAYPDPDAANSAVYDPSGNRVLGVYWKQKAKIWNPTNGATEAELVDNVGLTDGTWAPDGSFVITAAVDNTARIWDASRGDLVAILRHPGEVDSASFSPDGSRVIIGGPVGTAIYELPRSHLEPDELARILRCRVPFAVLDDRLTLRARAWQECQSVSR